MICNSSGAKLVDACQILIRNNLDIFCTIQGKDLAMQFTDIICGVCLEKVNHPGIVESFKPGPQEIPGTGLLVQVHGSNRARQLPGE